MTSPIDPGRREHLRFPITMRMEYLFKGRRSSATTTNLSKGGVYIRTDEALPVGKPIRLFIEWPAKLDGRCPLSLFVLGRIIRRDAGGAAIRIERYEFRLRPRAAVRQLPPMPTKTTPSKTSPKPMNF